MATAPPSARILSLDVVRGVAVMGILLANLPAFGLPESAYFSPLAGGGAQGWNAAFWFANFVLVEGKMRGLFTLLFGASMLVVIDAAEAKGDDAASVHLRRMATLFIIGCLHLYLLWWGDILSHYALVGAAAFMFARLRARWLVAFGIAMIALQVAIDLTEWHILLASAARDTPGTIATWNAFSEAFGLPPAATLLANIQAMRGSFVDGIVYRLANETTPVGILPAIGFQTLGTMLLGMAGYRSGMLTGGWSRRGYVIVALVCLGATLPLYAWLGLRTAAAGFDQRAVFFASIVASEPIRVITAFGYAALVMLMIRPGGALTGRVSAVGRAAFTNYLGTSVAMTFVFYGWGLDQFATWTRASLYWLAIPVWAAMLLWSPWWLARYRYGPLEWVWRSAARGALQPMRR